jgi:hypothetical protein
MAVCVPDTAPAEKTNHCGDLQLGWELQSNAAFGANIFAARLEH